MMNDKSKTRYRKLRLARQRLAPVAALLLVVSLLAGNGVAFSADSDKSSRKAASKGLTAEQKILHLLNRAGFGARPGDVERVRKLGVDKYLEMQLHPERLDDATAEARLKEFASLGMTLAEINEKYPLPQVIARQLGLRQPNQQGNQPNGDSSEKPEEAQKRQREFRRQLNDYYREHDAKPVGALLQELQAQKMVRAIYSERQLQEVMTDFWFNHFNVFWTKGGVKTTATDYEMNVIRPRTLGKFKDLLLATAKSPAMLQYLDNFQSSTPNPQLPGRRQGQANNRRPLAGFRQNAQTPQTDDEQMRRRQQQLPPAARRQPGINENYARELLELHTLGVDGGYTQKDVQEVARAFTGWTIERPFAGRGSRRAAGEFVFRPVMHDRDEKVILGQKIAAGGGIEDGEKVIEILARQPQTAKFIATKLARRFVSDNPPASLVDRIAGVYLKTDGDIRQMVKTIFTASEFYAPEAYRAKIKTPFELAVSAVRTLGGETLNARQLAQFVAKMGQPLYLYQPPTGYPDRAEQWVNTGALLERLNFSLALSSNRVLGTVIDPQRLGLAGASNASGKAQPLMDRAIAVLLNNEVSAQTRAVLTKQLQEGVAVKGELGDPAKIPAAAGAARAQSGEMADQMTGEDEAMQTPDRRQLAQRRQLQGNDAVGKAERQAANFERRFGNPATLVRGAAVAPEVAKVIGLVLGSPEFQRK